MTSSHTASAFIFLCSLAALACRNEVSLGQPPWEPPPPAPSRLCEPAPEPGLFAEIGAEYGPIRGMLGNPSNGVYVVAAQDKAAGTILRVLNGTPEPMGILGLAPAQMAMTRDSVFVTCPDSGQVFRVLKNGSKIESVLGQPDVRAIAAGQYDEIYWALAGETGSVRRYGFSYNRVDTMSAAKFPTGLAYDGRWLYVSSEGPLMADPGYNPRSLSVHCDGPTLALTESDLFCADGGSIHQIRRSGFLTSTRATFPAATVSNLLAGAGRLFFRLVPNGGAAGSSRIMAMALDDDAKPTVFATSPDNEAFLAMDRCNLYLAAGSSIMRWPL